MFTKKKLRYLESDIREISEKMTWNSSYRDFFLKYIEQIKKIAIF